MQSLFKLEFFPIFIFVILAITLSLIILGLSYILAIQNPDSEKLSAYECGFDPYEDARHTFDVKFYLTAILFIVFDIEALFLFPWSVCLQQLNSFGFWIMIYFIIELSVGFAYAWIMGALDWK